MSPGWMKTGAIEKAVDGSLVVKVNGSEVLKGRQLDRIQSREPASCWFSPPRLSSWIRFPVVAPADG